MLASLPASGADLLSVYDQALVNDPADPRGRGHAPGADAKHARRPLAALLPQASASAGTVAAGAAHRRSQDDFSRRSDVRPSSTAASSINTSTQLGPEPAPERVLLAELGGPALSRPPGGTGRSRLLRAAAVAGAARGTAVLRRAAGTGHCRGAGSRARCHLAAAGAGRTALRSGPHRHHRRAGSPRRARQRRRSGDRRQARAGQRRRAAARHHRREAGGLNEPVGRHAAAGAQPCFRRRLGARLHGPELHADLQPARGRHCARQRAAVHSAATCPPSTWSPAAPTPTAMATPSQDPNTGLYPATIGSAIGNQRQVDRAAVQHAAVQRRRTFVAGAPERAAVDRRQGTPRAHLAQHRAPGARCLPGRASAKSRACRR